MQDLWKRAQEIIARNRLLESVKGSGYHDDDRNLVHPERWQCPQKNGLPRISQHVVPFYGEREIFFAGDHAERVIVALQAWRAQQNRDVEQTGTERKLCRMIVRLQLDHFDGMASLKVWRDEWNDYLWCFEQIGIGLTGAQLDATDTA